MAFTPELPFPKTQGNPIRSRDWNALVGEVQRLDGAKVDRAGDAMTGPLRISNGVPPLAGTANNGALTVNAGRLDGAAGAELTLANIGYSSANSSSLGIRARRVSAGGDWTTSAIGLGMDVDSTPRAGASLWLSATRRVGVNTPAPLFPLHVVAPSPGGSFGGENPDGTSQGGNVPLVAQSTGTAFGVLNGNGRAAFALNIDNDTGAPGGRGVPTMYDKYDGSWRPCLSLKNGSVGVGTREPADQLDVLGHVRILSGTNPLRFTGGWTDFPSTGIDRAEICNDTGTYKTLMIVGNRSAGLTGNGPGRRVSIWDRLEVNGNLQVTGHLTGTTTEAPWFLGDGGIVDHWLRLTKGLTWQAGYHDLACGAFWANGATRFDLAEMTPVRAEDELEPGDVVVIDGEVGMRATRSRRPYDTSVFGIVSSREQAAMVIGGDCGPEQARDRKDQAPIALAGRVKAKVSSENGPVRIGDLLTTADTPGHLMRCTDRAKGMGAIAGKALEPFDGARGVISVLVTLQ